jgi:iron complex transport system ATP-binding protein
MAQEPKLMVFDEPTGNLDIANEQLIIDEAKKLAREKNISILSSLHDLNQALYFGDKFFFLKNGVVKYAGGEEVFTEEVIKDIFDIDVRIVMIDNQKVILGGYHNER